MTTTTDRPPEGPAWPPMAPAAPQRPSPPPTPVHSDEGRRHDVRRTLLAALACALGVLPLNELFTDRGWLIDVWLTMAIVVAPAALLRRTRPASAGQIWIGVVLLIPWLTVTFVRQHAVLGFIPLHGAWHDVGHLMTELHETSQHESVWSPHWSICSQWSGVVARSPAFRCSSSSPSPAQCPANRFPGSGSSPPRPAS
jgi:hypothetical protein